ncbi:hypothetical protein BT67DRAFT_11052 [Trichocladium antarcticum]|uniref:Uncharacterized protein n=1 Tax=Trichocladium antarcticum TaxID=1450529 RepID=A0AAN6UT51_9PEZI|nr:hypothetical protein BT67DRAFT_11052 [Trichocladium antarcticum]
MGVSTVGREGPGHGCSGCPCGIAAGSWPAPPAYIRPTSRCHFAVEWLEWVSGAHEAFAPASHSQRGVTIHLPKKEGRSVDDGRKPGKSHQKATANNLYIALFFVAPTLILGETMYPRISRPTLCLRFRGFQAARCLHRPSPMDDQVD